MPLRMRVHDREPIGMALRRFKKLIERSGMHEELRARQHYEKPCEQRRRSQLRKQKPGRKAQEQLEQADSSAKNRKKGAHHRLLFSFFCLVSATLILSQPDRFG